MRIAAAMIVAPADPKITSSVAVATRSCVALAMPRASAVVPCGLPVIGSTFRYATFAAT